VSRSKKGKKVLDMSIGAKDLSLDLAQGKTLRK